MENKECIYILTNPSFKEYVKIGVMLIALKIA